MFRSRIQFVFLVVVYVCRQSCRIVHVSAMVSHFHTKMVNVIDFIKEMIKSVRVVRVVRAGRAGGKVKRNGVILILKK